MGSALVADLTKEVALAMQVASWWCWVAS